MAQKKKHLYFNKVPKYCTADKNDSCIIFERGTEIRNINNIEVFFKAIKIVRYNGNESLIEEAKGANAHSMFLSLRTGSLLPETYNDLELTWYEDQDENGIPVDLEEILVMCSI